jgi:hypothetical protein
MEVEFSRQLFKKYSNISFIKTSPVGAELFQADRRTDGQTDMTKLINSFRNFALALKNDCQIIYSAFSKEHGTSLGLNQPHIQTGIKTAGSYIKRFRHIRFSINTIRFVNRLKSSVKQTDT